LQLGITNKELKTSIVPIVDEKPFIANPFVNRKLKQLQYYLDIP